MLVLASLCMPLQVSNRGCSYGCICSSLTWPLTFLETASIVVAPLDMHVHKGDTVTLTCQAAGNPQPTIR